MMFLAAIFAFAVVLVRASVQSITADEAAGWVLGPSPLLLRLPTLICAALFIAAAAGFSRWVAKQPYVQLATFTCLVFNPYILDHLVAAHLAPEPDVTNMVDAMFYRLNPELANIYVLPVFAAIPPWIFLPIVLASLVCLLSFRRHRRDNIVLWPEKRPGLAIKLAASAGFAYALSGFLLLPPLLTAAAGAIAGSAAVTRTAPHR